jgi:16S rRNA processing protein RimM
VPDDPDVFLDGQLVGLRAELEDGSAVGTVAEVLHLPHGDVLVVRRDGETDREREVLVPFVAAMVPVVDVAGGRVVLTPPDGLLDLTDAPERPDDDEAAPDGPPSDAAPEP